MWLYAKSSYFRTTCFDGHINYNLIFFLTEDFERCSKLHCKILNTVQRGGVTERRFVKIRLKSIRISDLVINILDLTDTWNQGLALPSRLIIWDAALPRNCERSGCLSDRCCGYRKVWRSLPRPATQPRTGSSSQATAVAVRLELSWLIQLRSLCTLRCYLASWKEASNGGSFGLRSFTYSHTSVAQPSGWEVGQETTLFPSPYLFSCLDFKGLGKSCIYI